MIDPPIACTLNGRQAADRQAMITQLCKDALIDTEPTAAGLRARLRDSPEVERRVRDMIKAESECCPFLSFELDHDDDHLRLEIRGPADGRAVIESFFAPTPG